MFNKRGISAIVATVMIILITVAAIGILWAAIIPMIQTNLDFSSLQGRVNVLEKGYTAYDSANKIASVQVKRDVDDGVMDRIKITFEVGGNSHSSSVIAPPSGGTRVYTFDMSGIGEPDSVSVAPIFAVGNKEKEGEITSTVEIPKSRISGSTGVAYEIGREYFGDGSCLEILNFGDNTGSGIYTIDPDGKEGEDSFEVYCDMTTDNGGWTLMTMSTGPHGVNIFSETTENRNVASGNIRTDFALDDGIWYSDIRWGPATAQSTSWTDVTYTTYNKRNSGAVDWLVAVGKGGNGFTPEVEYKCSWNDKYVSVSGSENVYTGDVFNAANWNIPNPPTGGSWDAVLPGIHITTTANGVLSKTHGVGGIECNSEDVRSSRIQVWVR